MDYEKILIVEDNVDLAFGIKLSLEKEDMKVITAETLSEAEEMIKSQEIGTIILDVMLPDGKGFDFCEKVRKESDVPIIFLTACDEEVDIVRGLDIGGDDYITKPFKLQELISRVKAVRRRYRKPVKDQKNSCLISKDIIIDKLTAKVCKKGIELQLTPTEYQIVYILIHNSNQIITRDQILDKLWDSHGDFVEDKTLTVHMSRLRDKLEDFPNNPEYIITVRGKGYKWNQKVCSWE